MKKLLGMILALTSITFVASSADARTGGAAAGQVRIQVGQVRRHRQGRWNNRRPSVVTQTRIVQRGRQRFRETYRVIYRLNGRTETRLISRVRIA